MLKTVLNPDLSKIHIFPGTSSIHKVLVFRHQSAYSLLKISRFCARITSVLVHS